MITARPKPSATRATRQSSRHGFTLIELIVVMAVIGLLVALLLPAVQRTREAARRTSCRDHLRQLGIALHNHHDQYREFPAGAESEWSWNARILPQLDQQNTYEKFHFDLEPFDSANTAYVGQHLPILLCPSDPHGDAIYVANFLGGVRFALTNYIGSIDTATSRGMFKYSQGTRIAEVTDGTSQTFFVGERGVINDGTTTHGWWAWGGEAMISSQNRFEPGTYNNPACLLRWWSYHPGGANFLLVDGSVRTVAYTIDQNVFNALGTKNGGEVVTF